MGVVLSSVYGGGINAPDDDDESSTVSSFHSSDKWKLHFNTVKETPQLMVINFTASWCGPCRFLKPAVVHMASKYSDVHFAKIDVDELDDVAKEFKVRAMPTFVLVKEGKEVDRIVGARKEELEQKIAKHHK